MSEVSTAIVEIPLAQVADRIHAHLKRLEAAQPEESRNGEYTGRTFYGPSAVQAGAYVSVSYVTYQGRTNLTRQEAVAYLSALDNGFEGRHFEWLRDNPIEVSAPEIRFHALVSSRYGFTLYAVTRRTKTRLYGHKIKGADPGQFVDRDLVLKMNATEADYDAAVALEDEANRRRNEVARWYRSELDKIAKGTHSPAPDRAGE